MNLEQAINLLTAVTSELQLSRQKHQEIVVALNTIMEFARANQPKPQVIAKYEPTPEEPAKAEDAKEVKE